MSTRRIPPWNRATVVYLARVYVQARNESRAHTKIVSDYFNYDDYFQIIQEFKLLPNDAQIALTCKHYGIDTILTFDEDFKRVPWLKAAP